MQAYTATLGVGQWVSRPAGAESSSQTAVRSYPNFIEVRFVWQEMPPFVIGNEPSFMDEQSLAQLYAEFAEEDRALANAGLADYARMLAAEDAEE